MAMKRRSEAPPPSDAQNKKHCTNSGNEATNTTATLPHPIVKRENVDATESINPSASNRSAPETDHVARNAENAVHALSLPILAPTLKQDMISDLQKRLSLYETARAAVIWEETVANLETSLNTFA